MGQASPRAVLAVLLALQFLVWALTPGATGSGLAKSVLESALWGREWIIVSYKHPALPGWCLNLAFALFGKSVYAMTAVSQLFVITTMLCVYALAEDLLENPWAAVVAAGTVAWLIFGNVIGEIFNHNIAQLPFWAAIVLFTRRAVRRQALSDWLLLGAISGLGMYAKLSTGLIIAACFGWLLAAPQRRALLKKPGIWFSAGLFILILMPLAIAIWQQHFLVFTYFEARSAARAAPWISLLEIAGWIALIASLPVLGLWLSGIVKGRDILGLLRVKPEHGLVGFAVFLPMGVVLCLSLLGRVVALWTTPMFNLVGLLLIAPRASAITRAQAMRFMAVTISFMLLNMVGFTAYRELSLHIPHKAPWDLQSLPQQQIADEMTRRFEAATGSRLRIVAGTQSAGGIVAFWSHSNPSLFNEINPVTSPWITGDRIAREGMLVVWVNHDDAEAAAARYIEHNAVQTASFRWSANPKSKPYVLNYIILPPVGAQRAPD